MFSPREFRASLGMFATGVTIVTARTAEGERVGLTANSFNSGVTDPPLVLWSLARAAGSLPAFSAGSHYAAINILAADQRRWPSAAARGADRWTGVAFTEGAGRAPLLAGAAATFECFNRSRYEEGDHVIFVGEAERCTHRTRPRRCCSMAASSTPSTRCRYRQPGPAGAGPALRGRLPATCWAGQPCGVPQLRAFGGRAGLTHIAAVLALHDAHAAARCYEPGDGPGF